MATQEFYIREASETAARGPFTTEQMVSLGEGGQLSKDTLFYDINVEQWTRIADAPDILAAVFPAKQALKLKPPETPRPVVHREKNPTIVIEDILAAAEGRTEDTKEIHAPAITREHAAAFGLYFNIGLLLIAAASFILPSITAVATRDPAVLLRHPLALIGAFDVLLALLLLLQVTQAYGLVRFAAMLGLGFSGFLLWTQHQPAPLAALAAGSAGLYFCTVFVSFPGLGIAAGVGFAGMLGYAFYALS